MPEEAPDDDSSSPQANPGTIFAFFNEIGIIQQLSRAMFEARLPDGIIVQHFSVLNHLIRMGDGRTPLDIARAFQTPKASLTNTLAGLEKRGFIRMEPNPKDGRSKLVYITDKGRAFRDEAIGLLVPDILALSDQLDLEEIMALTPKLAQIRKVLDDNRNG